MRVFIAINIDASLRAPLAEIQGKLKPTAAPVSWVKPANLHFTLKFLGEVAEADLPTLREAVRRSLAGIGPFTLSLAGLGTFPPKGRPRVVWVGIAQGAAEMEKLRGRIDETLLPLGFPREPRPFQPHLTLGRVKGGGRLDPLLEGLRRVEVGQVGRMQVRCVELMQSQLHPRGAIYTSLEAVPLKEGT
ncbi:MAG: RNA 2',3'-cyclic phosphodiesterase [Candidatus Methylomirabilales bacterium]